MHSPGNKQCFGAVFLAVSVVLVAFLSSIAQAQAPKSNQLPYATPGKRYIPPPVIPTPTVKIVATKPNLPKSGVLSRSAQTGYGNKSYEVPWGPETGGTNEQTPLAGSVSKLSERELLAKVFNNSDQTYSISAKVLQYNARGVQIRSDSFSATIKPKSSYERRVPRGIGAEDIRFSMENWSAK